MQQKKHRSWNLHLWWKSGSSMSCNFFHDNNCNKPSDVAFLQSSNPCKRLLHLHNKNNQHSSGSYCRPGTRADPNFPPKGHCPSFLSGKKNHRDSLGKQKQPDGLMSVSRWCQDVPSLNKNHILVGYSLQNRLYIWNRYLLNFFGSWVMAIELSTVFWASDFRTVIHGTHMTRGPILQALRKPKTLVDVR